MIFLLIVTFLIVSVCSQPCTLPGTGCMVCDPTQQFCETCVDDINTVPRMPYGDDCICPLGTFDANPTPAYDCQPCDEGCLNCTVGDCLECIGENMHIAGPGCICDPGFWDIDPDITTYGVDCQPLLEGCSERDNVECTKCADQTNSYIDNLVCKCNNGFYDSNGGTNYDQLTCDELGQGCKTGDPTTCTSCWSVNAHPVGNLCICNNTYYDDNPSNGNGDLNCVSCEQGCDTCTSVACSACYGSSMHISGTTCVCDDEYYDSNVGSSRTDISCVPLPLGCKTGVDGTGDCLSCISGYFDADPGVNVVCQQMGEGCATSNETDCLSCVDEHSHISGLDCVCNDGYYDSDTDTSVLVCTALGEGCRIGNAFVCTTCWDTAYSHVTTWPNCICWDYRHDDDPLTGNLNLHCVQNDEGCKKITLGNNCTECMDINMHVEGTRCVCDAGFFDVDPGTTVLDITCEQLGEGCEEKVYMGNCTKCLDQDNSEINGLVCECKDGYYDSNPGTLYDELSCLKLGEGCETRNATDCLACLDVVYSEISGLDCVCKHGYYDSEVDTNVLTCSNCDLSCNGCYDGSNADCDSCASGYYDVAGTCLPLNEGCATRNVTDCLTCLDVTNSHVASGVICECKHGYYDSEVDPNVLTCSNCDLSCNGCYDSSNADCDSCASGYYDVTGTCLPLNEGCATRNVTDCLTCLDVTNSHVASGVICECNHGYYDSEVDPNILTCSNCDLSCNGCYDGGSDADCDSCASGYYDVTGTCLPLNEGCATRNVTDCLTCLDVTNSHVASGVICECNHGYYDSEVDTNVLACSNCDLSCNGCSDGSDADCESCNSGYYDASGSCLLLGVGCETRSDIACLTCLDIVDSHVNGLDCECNTGYFDSNTDLSILDCEECGVKCSTCSDLNQCDTCIEKYTNAPLCDKCSDEFQDFTKSCDECIEGYEITEGICVKSSNALGVTFGVIGGVVGFFVVLIVVFVIVGGIVFKMKLQKKRNVDSDIKVEIELNDQVKEPADDGKVKEEVTDDGKKEEMKEVKKEEKPSSKEVK